MMFERLTIGTKIALGFTLVLSMTLVISIISYFSLKDAQHLFLEYQNKATASLSAVQLHSAMLETVTLGKNHVMDPARENLSKEYFDSISNFEKAKDESLTQISDPKQKDQIQEATSRMNVFRVFVAKAAKGETDYNLLASQTSRQYDAVNRDLSPSQNQQKSKNNKDLIALISTRQQTLMEARQAYYKALYSSDFELMQASALSLTNLRKQLLDDSKTTSTGSLKNLFQKAANELDPIIANQKQIIVINTEKESLLANELQSTGPEVSAILNSVAQQIEDEKNTIGPALAQMITYSLATILIAAIAAFVLGILIAWQITRNTVNSVRKVVHLLLESTTNVTSSATRLSGTADTLAQAAADQSASLEETSVSIDELTAMVKANTENANQSFEVSTTSKTKSDLGKKLIDNMSHSMKIIDESNQLIQEQTEKSGLQISEIVNVINNIGKKTQVINDIVFQTKLLSFNASVEAARAGEHGKGFAVVAEEVGNLAQKSGLAANEISALLSESTEKVERIVSESQGQIEKLMKESKIRVEEGTKVALSCSETLSEITNYATRVNQMLSEISAASNEQSIGISQINIAVEQLDRITQKNAQMADNTATYGKALNSEAVMLKNVVTSLYALVDKPKAGHSYEAPVKTEPSKRDNIYQIEDQPRSFKAQKSNTKVQSMGSGAFAVNADEVPMADDPDFDGK